MSTQVERWMRSSAALQAYGALLIFMVSVLIVGVSLIAVLGIDHKMDIGLLGALARASLGFQVFMVIALAFFIRDAGPRSRIAAFVGLLAHAVGAVASGIDLPLSVGAAAGFVVWVACWSLCLEIARELGKEELIASARRLKNPVRILVIATIIGALTIHPAVGGLGILVPIAMVWLVRRTTRVIDAHVRDERSMLRENQTFA